MDHLEEGGLGVVVGRGGRGGYLAVPDDTDVALSYLRVELTELLVFHVVVGGGHTDDEDDGDKDSHAFQPTFSDAFVYTSDD